MFRLLLVIYFDLCLVSYCWGDDIVF